LNPLSPVFELLTLINKLKMFCCCCNRTKTQLHKQILEQIFRKTKEYPKRVDTYSPAELKTDELRAFVADKAKPLLDYLENNQRKLQSVGKHLNERCKASKHPVDHLLTLLVLNNVLPIIHKLSCNRKDMLNMVKSVGKGSPSKGQSLEFLMNKNIADNYFKFENKLIGILNYLLALKTNRNFVFK
jgi:hypothetical protein